MALLNRKKKYKKPRFPEGEFWVCVRDGQFLLELGRWNRHQFWPLDDGGTGAVYAQQPSGRPQILRVLKQKDNELTCVDGGGDRVVYVLVPEGAQ